MDFDVYHCYVICGASALVAGALTRTHMHSLLGEDTRRILWLYRLGFAGLVPFLAFAFASEAQRPSLVPSVFALAVSATACLAWALRELNGEPLPAMRTALAVAAIGVVVLVAGETSTAGVTVSASAAFVLIDGMLLADQLRLAIQRKRVTHAEQGLIAVLVLFLAIFSIALWHSWTQSTQAYPSHGLFLPDPLLSVAATMIALMPLAVSSLVLAVINERLIKRLENVALTDELTGVLSRRGLRELGPLLIAEHRRRQGLIAVFMADIDLFKRVNDTHGHHVGDQAIRHVSGQLREVLRADALLARYGGEEFTALVPVDTADDAVQVGERLRRAVADMPCPSDVGPLKLTVSVGGAMLVHCVTLEQALNLADERLYQAKQAGRNRVVWN
jgi:diguanylate cyclase (GGDEF)-like protein